MKLSSLIAITLLALSAVGCSDSVSQQESNRFLTNAEADMRISSRSAAVAPEYPVNIDCDEWRAMTSHDEKVAFLELLADEYKALSTDELALLCMAYPLNIDAYAFDDLATGLRRVMSKAGCYQELLQREDCAAGIVRALETCDVAVYMQSSAKKIDKYSLINDCNLLMQMLQLPEVSANLSADEAASAASYLYYLAEIEREVLSTESYSVLNPLKACEACLNPGVDQYTHSTIRDNESPDVIFNRLKNQDIKTYSL